MQLFGCTNSSVECHWKNNCEVILSTLRYGQFKLGGKFGYVGEFVTAHMHPKINENIAFWNPYKFTAVATFNCPYRSVEDF